MEEKEISNWVELYSQSLLNRALVLVSNREDAKDLVQETFLSAVSAYNSFERKATPLSWLQNILRNKVSDYYRKKYRTPQSATLPDFFDEFGAWMDDTVLNEWTYDEEDEQVQQMFSDMLHRCMENLPSQWQLTIKLYYIGEKKASDVCQELRITTTNLWKILQRGRMQLRKCIELNREHI